MVKPNYPFEKRQRDLAKKEKQEQKRRQKLAGKAGGEIADETNARDEGDLPTPGAATPEA